MKPPHIIVCVRCGRRMLGLNVPDDATLSWFLDTAHCDTCGRDALDAYPAPPNHPIFAQADGTE